MQSGAFIYQLRLVSVSEAQQSEKGFSLSRKKQALKAFGSKGLLNFKAALNYFPTVKTAVSLPQKSLASVFGMGTGVSSSLKAQPV